MKKVQQGFTLIELMIVVAIIGILAAIAIPQYQDYTIRSQVSEGLMLAAGVKTAVAEYYNNYGEYPADNTTAGLAAPASINGKYVSQVEVSTASNEGIITVTYANNGTQEANAKINNATLTLTAPSGSAGSIAWECEGATTLSGHPEWLPSACR